MTTKARAKAPPPDVDDSAEATTVREETLAIGAETLAREHADVVIERVRQWLDVMMSDARGRLTALERSRTRTRRALEKYDSRGSTEDDVGIEMLVEFAHTTLEIERGILEETMKNLEAMRTKVEFESANLALRWLRRSNCGGDDDGQGERGRSRDGWTQVLLFLECVRISSNRHRCVHERHHAREVGKERRRSALAERRSRRRATLYVIPLALGRTRR